MYASSDAPHGIQRMVKTPCCVGKQILREIDLLNQSLMGSRGLAAGLFFG
jgi:hypothetical protein